MVRLSPFFKKSVKIETMLKLLVANWKSSPHNVTSAIRLAKSIDKKGVVIAPPYPFLEQVGKAIKYAKLGAQDIFWGDIGPYTGEVSWHQLRHLKVTYVIIGHSERRRYLAETDELINKKVKAALKAGINVILCVGESLDIRNQGKKAAKEFIKSQLTKGLSGLAKKPKNYQTNKLLIAYEPVWAISTEKGSRPDTPEDAVEMIKFIKNLLHTIYHIRNSRVLYGGSVTAKNAHNFIAQKELDGALVGGVSLEALEFNRVISSII